MLLTHLGKAPTIHPDAWVAPNAVVCGDVTIGAGCRVQYGAQLVAEGGRITLGEHTIVMQNAVLRSADAHPLAIGAHCLVGPQAHVVGSSIDDEVFIATGAAVFHGSRIGRGCEVRINAVVHLRTVLPPGTTVPIGWVAVGDPVQVLPASEHERIWAVQQPLNFPLTVYGIDRAEASMVSITRKLSQRLGAHATDAAIEGSEAFSARPSLGS